LRGHRVLAVKKEFVADGENSFWTFSVEYLDGGGSGALLPGGRPKVDYKEVRKPEEFEVFSPVTSCCGAKAGPTSVAYGGTWKPFSRRSCVWC
jgi:hypothetical protein